MSQRDQTPFQKRCVAVSVAAICASLSACSTMPHENDGSGGAYGESGAETRTAGARLWDRARYLLGFEVDEEDAVMPGATDVVRSDEWSDIAAASEAADANPDVANESIVDEARFDAEQGTLVLGERRAPGTEVDNPLVTAQGMTHEVDPGESLWDIAKRTTGDATNWHALADVNDLAPDAAVYPGQVLVIPADMVRPELAGLASTADAPESDRLVAPDPSEGEGEGEGQVAGVNDAGARLAADVSDLVAGAGDLAVDTADAAVEALPGGDTEIRLEAGETLWDFAKRTTGDATNWRTIAETNDFSEERATKVREGESIAVPTALLRDETESTDVMTVAAVADVEADDLEAVGTDLAEADDVAPSSDRGTGATTGARDALVAIPDAPTETDVTEELAATDEVDAADGEASRLAATEPEEAGEPVRIVEAAYRTEPGSVVAGQPAAEGLPTEIMVSGTYYPKAVYNDADFSSSLLMRVSPGTTLQVSRAVGPWYEVTTDQGTGYVHARDIK